MHISEGILPLAWAAANTAVSVPFVCIEGSARDQAQDAGRSGGETDDRIGWDGVDTAVVGRYASELGKEPQQPFLNLQGDSLLFAFAISAAFGGFIAGYFWHELFGGGNTFAAGNDRDRRVPPREAKRDV